MFISIADVYAVHGNNNNNNNNNNKVAGMEAFSRASSEQGRISLLADQTLGRSTLEVV